MGTPSPAAPSCRRADGTALESLPERIGELKNLRNLCVVARSVGPRPRGAMMRRRFIDRCNLTKLPDSICNLGSISSLYAELPMPVAFGIQSGSALALQGRVAQCPQGATGVRVQHEQPDVAVRAARNPGESAAAPSERCCRRNAEYNELQALPDLASCRSGSNETLLYVCVRGAPVSFGAATKGGFGSLAGS